MQGILLQVIRFGFLILLWLFVYAIIRAMRADLAAAGGARMPLTSGRAERKQRAARSRGTARYLVVTAGALANTRITLGTQPVLIGRADDSTLVLTDDYASERHARISPRGDDWYVEDLGSTNGTYLDRAKVTTAVRAPINTPIRVGKTVIELRP
ncbi:MULTISPECIES: FHA domain-containing protein FhaB/FipA [Gordonia]|uniref:FHA domain-containing protein n=2 Tax=Gordonia TaxID=2053 RepID=L7LMZ4_9ACTN|nr:MULTISPECIES: FHA domain-containing protein [Gordonia]AUH67462.1 FHA domain-containing protein [Gordonia sp. YC-JH1]KJR09158.1 signal peptide protein [Gordonia sihwensis]KXT57035.1 signal peptide protein [Gordonia sp. QH-12]MBY4568538.1 FHA domain-containing protein [Gordonia sihwensis]WFN92879.1 FHA domain-containing protein [Gordonia sihwensis]